jgi:hypothetical protein
MSSTLSDADKALDIFISSCFAAGPWACAFHNNATSVAEIASSLDAVLASIQQTPLPVFLDTSSSYSYAIVDYTFVKSTIFNAFYQPAVRFPVLAQALADLALGNASTIYLVATATDTAVFSCDPKAAPLPHDYESEVSIICGDAAPVNDSIAELQALFEMEHGISKNFADLWADWRVMCA